VLLEELVLMHFQVERHDPQIGEDVAIGLVTIPAHEWGRDLGLAGSGGYISRAAGSGSEMEARDLKKKNHAAI
jgi:hypothetical protein